MFQTQSWWCFCTVSVCYQSLLRIIFSLFFWCPFVVLDQDKSFKGFTRAIGKIALTLTLSLTPACSSFSTTPWLPWAIFLETHTTLLEYILYTVRRILNVALHGYSYMCSNNTTSFFFTWFLPMPVRCAPVCVWLRAWPFLWTDA